MSKNDAAQLQIILDVNQQSKLHWETQRGQANYSGKEFWLLTFESSSERGLQNETLGASKTFLVVVFTVEVTRWSVSCLLLRLSPPFSGRRPTNYNTSNWCFNSSDQHGQVNTTGFSQEISQIWTSPDIIVLSAQPLSLHLSHISPFNTGATTFPSRYQYSRNSLVANRIVFKLFLTEKSNHFPLFSLN